MACSEKLIGEQPDPSTRQAATLISTMAEPPTQLQLIRRFLRLGATTAGRGLTNLRSAPLLNSPSAIVRW
jgi:hypothetical protein